MSLNWPNPHYGFVPEYQVSSWPYVTSSQIVAANDIKEVKFPGVTRWITIHNSDHGGSKVMKFGFTQNCFKAVNSNYFTLHAGEMTERLELKCTSVFITANNNTTANKSTVVYSSPVMNIYTKDADSFKKSKTQIAYEQSLAQKRMNKYS